MSSFTRAVTPMAFARAIAHAYAARGLDPAAALDAAGLSLNDLDQPTRMTAGQFERLSEHAMRELDDEALGWFSRRLPWGSYGLLARGSITAHDLHRAIKRWCRHHRLLTDDVSLELTLEEDAAQVILREHRDLGAMREFCTVSLLRNVHGLASWLIDSRLPLLESRFAFPAPEHADAYPRMFPGRVLFDAHHSALRFDAGYLKLPLRRDETALQHMLRRALPLMVHPYRRDRLLSERVRASLQEEPGADAEHLARALNTSVRTLHRQLAQAGTSLQRIKDEVHREHACEALLRSDRPIKQIAAACGYGNDKSFLRAFKHWTGLTPSEFRRQGANAPGTAQATSPST